MIEIIRESVQAGIIGFGLGTAFGAILAGMVIGITMLFQGRNK